MYLYRRRRRPQQLEPVHDEPKDSLDTFVMPVASTAGPSSRSQGDHRSPSAALQLTEVTVTADRDTIAPAAGAGAMAAAAAPSPAAAADLASLPALPENLEDGPLATVPTRPTSLPPASIASLQAAAAATADRSLTVRAEGCERWHPLLVLSRTSCYTCNAPGFVCLGCAAGFWKLKPVCSGRCRCWCAPAAVPLQQRHHPCHAARFCTGQDNTCWV